MFIDISLIIGYFLGALITRDRLKLKLKCCAVLRPRVCTGKKESFLCQTGSCSREVDKLEIVHILKCNYYFAFTLATGLVLN